MSYRPEWDQSGDRGFGSGSSFGGFRSGRPLSITTTIIIACVVVQVFTAIGTRFGDPIARYFGLGLSNAYWVYPFFTYCFVHSAGGLFHLAFNMLVLWFIGSDLERSLGRRRYLALYFGGSLAGAVLYLISQVFLQATSATLIGASGAVLALIFYMAWQSPDRQIIFIFIPLRMRTLAYIYLALDLYPILLGSNDGVAHFCHLGGALFGYLFWKLRWDPLASLGDVRADLQRRSEVREGQREVRDDEEMDRILAKIAAEGLPSLTPAERRFLEERSKKINKMRQGR